MKHLIICIVTTLFLSNNCICAQYATIYTNGGQAIQVLSRNELTSSEISSLTAECQATFPNVTILSPASRKYNCHYYAWCTRDGATSLFWMNPLRTDNTANVSKYWTNDFYSEVFSTQQAEKIVYYSNSNTSNDANITHSAVVSSVSGYYESKWGSWPLVRHLPTDVPSGYGTIMRYFAHISPTIESGNVTTSAGNGSIELGQTVSFHISLSANVLSKISRMDFSLLDGHTDDAFEVGKAELVSCTNTDIVITFNHVGIYEMYLDYYNMHGEKIATCWYEILVEA
ncbi:MAG: hypothetical protein SOX40_06175 [Bacteroidaceae bacterium]|nr:hypothetical protein [Bacteroidaceae bacterium]